MRVQRLIVFGMFVAEFLVASDPARAQTTAPGPYYATPSWDQKFACDTPATCPRFVVLSNWNNEAVLDRETGLVWEKTLSTGSFGRAAADDSCNLRAVGGREGWRVPNAQEIRTLVDPANANPALPAGHPFVNVSVDEGIASPGQPYWTSTAALTSIFGAGNDIIGVSFRSAGSNSTLNGGPLGSARVWCVRGPSNPPR